MQHVITHLPTGLIFRAYFREAVRAPRTATNAQGAVRFRARGPRQGLREALECDPRKARHYTAYVDGNDGGRSYPKVYWRYVGWNADKGKPHVRFDLNGGKMPKGVRYAR